MNSLLIIALCVVAASCKLSEPKSDEAFPICSLKDRWLTKKEQDDNKTEKESRSSANLDPKAVTDSDNIYEYKEKLAYLVNLQIRVELFAFYNYLAMARFFQRYDQDRAGFAKYFRASASEELEHAEMFMKYQQMRGGDVKLYNLPAPESHNWTNAKDVLETAFALEKNVTDSILCLQTIAVEKFEDTDFDNFLSDKIIPEQYEGMKEIKTHIKNLQRACPANKDTKCDSYPLYEMQYEMKINK